MPDIPDMLDGIRVLDLTTEPGFLAGKILAELGADVVKIEPPGGDPARRRGPYLGDVADPERSLPWLALNTSKRGITLDLDAPGGAARFRRLVARADVVLESFAPDTMARRGLGYESLRLEHPRLVYCAITPFGRTGPYAGFRAGDLGVVAMGGNAWMTGHPDRPPVRCSLPTAYLHAGPEAAAGVVTALFARESSGRGQLVDVSLQECQLATLVTGPGMFAHTGRAGRRTGPRLGRTREIWRAADGYVSFGLRGGPARIPNLRATVAYMAEEGMAPDWLRSTDWSAYNHNTVGDAEIERLEAAFAAFFASRSRRELYEQALARRILLAPCNDAAEIAAQPQLRDRGLFQRVDYPEWGASLEQPAFFAVSPSARIGVRRRAPRIGEHDAEVEGELGEADARPRAEVAGGSPTRGPGAGVFAGVNVLELGAGAAGPVATRYLADQGATVVRIESAARPDFLRLLHWTPDNPHGLDGAPMFVLMNPNKRSVSVNLGTAEGVELVRRLAGWADVVSENFSPGVMAKWGLDAESLRRERPDLVYVSSCLFGQTGPQRLYPGFGGQGSAIAGFNHLTGWPDREAVGPHGTITDSLSPRYVALLIAAALLHRKRTGAGQTLDVSQIETGVYSLSEMMLRHAARGEVLTRRGNASEAAAPHGVYPCRGEDRWIAIAVCSDAEWRALAQALGRAELAVDPRFAATDTRLAHRVELDALVAESTRGHDRYELMRALQAVGVEAGVVQDFADLHDDPQLAHRGHFEVLEHVHLGPLAFEHYGTRLSESPPALRTPGPNLGEHNQEILGGVLGLSESEIAALREREVLV